MTKKHGKCPFGMEDCTDAAHAKTGPIRALPDSRRGEYAGRCIPSEPEPELIGARYDPINGELL
jgi:hypothetical protein